uniref:Uncharacterized protein n=1 Tax=Anisakis simplex TaxID=6269 RepID=A0A0M3JEZ4_ANISI
LSHARKASGNVHDERNEIYSNGLFQLDNPLPPPRLDEIGIENNSDEDRGWSGETIKPIEPSESNDIKPPESPLSQSAGPSWQAPLPFIAPPHNRTQHTANVIRTPPLPFNHNSNNIADHDNNFQLIPPKVIHTQLVTKFFA